MNRSLRRLALLFALSACTEDSSLLGPPTEAACPPPPTGTTLTYENFAKPFMEAYCTRCHDSKLVGAARRGATSFYNFDTLFGIRAVKARVDETSASGPAATNTSMPPDGAKPSVEERRKLGEWIACGLPTAP